MKTIHSVELLLAFSPKTLQEALELECLSKLQQVAVEQQNLLAA